MSAKNDSRLRRARRARVQMRKLEANRLSVHRTPRHIYAQIFAPAGDKVLVCASTLDKELRGGATGNDPCANHHEIAPRQTTHVLSPSQTDIRMLSERWQRHQCCIDIKAWYDLRPERRTA